MIQCGKCGFSVSESMKHALMTNSCPACGTDLFSNEDMNLLSSVQSDLTSQSFAFNFTDETIYDISLFIFKQFKHGLGRTIVKKEVLREVNSADSESGGDKDESQSDDFEDIRKEVENEYREEIEGLTENEDIFSKAERLKRLAQQRSSSDTVRPRISSSKKTGVRVSRVE